MFFNNTLYFGPRYGHVTAWPIVGDLPYSQPDTKSTDQFVLRGSAVPLALMGRRMGLCGRRSVINCIDISNTGVSSEVLHALDAS